MPMGSDGVIVVALITIFMGAIIGSAKDDIKKALAGSTMSQIGYMMLAVGLGPIGTFSPSSTWSPMVYSKPGFSLALGR